MPRLGYQQATCCRCHRVVWLPYPTYRPSDLKLYEQEAIVCAECRAVYLGGDDAESERG